MAAFCTTVAKGNNNSKGKEGGSSQFFLHIPIPPLPHIPQKSKSEGKKEQQSKKSNLASTKEKMREAYLFISTF